MTKAERIYGATRFQCKKHIEAWGYEENVGFNGVEAEEVISVRTCNDIQKIIDSKRRGLCIDRKLNVSSPEKLDAEEKVLNMVQATLNNSRKSLKDFNTMLKAI